MVIGLRGKDHIEVRRSIRPSTTTAVVFSSVNANGFSFYSLFEKFSENLNRVYIRDPYDMWYVNGISTDISTWEALTQTIAALCVDLRSSRLLTFGSSMGGYAALRCSLDLNVDLCVATSPQTLLDPRLPHTPASEVNSAGRDISYRLSEPTDTKYRIFFGAADFVDLFNVSRANWARDAVYPISGQDHLVAQHLAKSGVYEHLIKQFVRGRSYDVNSALLHCGVRTDAAILDPVVVQLVCRVVESRYLGGHRPIVPMLRALNALGPFADGHHIHAQILFSQGKLDDAIEEARIALGLAPASVTTADTLAEILRRAGKNSEAIAAYEHCLTLRSKHYSALCALAELNAEIGDLGTATNYLEQAVHIRPRLKKAQVIAKKLGLAALGT